MHGMGPAPGQQAGRAREVSGREKQGAAPGMPHSRARAMPGTRRRAVPARACAKNAHVTASLEVNLTSITNEKVTLLGELYPATSAARNRSGASSGLARCPGRPGPGPGGAVRLARKAAAKLDYKRLQL